VFKTEDLKATWPPSISSPQNPTAAALAIVASLLFSDRQPWFLLHK
jgi:hypothetical protein